MKEVSHLDSYAPKMGHYLECYLERSAPVKATLERPIKLSQNKFQGGDTSSQISFFFVDYRPHKKTLTERFIKRFTLG